MNKEGLTKQNKKMAGNTLIKLIGMGFFHL